MDKPVESLHLNSLYQQYPVVRKLKACIDEFRQIFIHKNMPRLYLFIECYKKSEFAPIASFAKGLERDIDAVENAVASPLSNGFVEGINNRTKMIKRVSNHFSYTIITKLFLQSISVNLIDHRLGMFHFFFLNNCISVT